MFAYLNGIVITSINRVQ